MQFLVFLVVMAATVWALFEILQTDSRQVRFLSRPFWVLAVVLVPFAGVLGWFLLGRPKVAVGTPGPGHPPTTAPSFRRPSSREYVARPAPDDDPEFLRRLAQQAEHQKMLRKLEQDFDSGRTGDAKTGDPKTGPRAGDAKGGPAPTGEAGDPTTGDPATGDAKRGEDPPDDGVPAR